MSVRKRTFSNAISDKILELLESNNDLDFVKTIMKGNLKLLPAPEKYPDIMPVIFVDIQDLYNTRNVNGKQVMATVYEFKVTYVKYYAEEYSYDVKEQAIKEAEIVADTLVEDYDLDIMRMEQGNILATDVPHIGFNTTENQVFENLKLPVIVIDIDYIVYFQNIK
jgi:hypothetical protein